MAAQYVRSQKGHNLLVHDGYVFRKQKVSLDKVIWQCTEYTVKKCRGRVHTIDGVAVKSTSHNHVPDAAKVESWRTIAAMKSQAASLATTRHIIATETARASSSIIGQLPLITAMTRAIQRNRMKISAPLPNPLNLPELVIPEDSIYRKTISGDTFLKFDSGAGNDRFLVFTTDRNLDLMAKTDHWFSGGTFKVAPGLFKQVLSIHIWKFNTVIGMVFVLMPNCLRTSYQRVLAALKSLKPELNPKSIMTDFEQGAIGAWQAEFSNAHNRGCFFHHSQSYYRKLQNIRLSVQYGTDPEFAIVMRMLPALAFVPRDDVVCAFVTLQNFSYFRELLEPILDYFEETWIGKLRRGQRGRRGERHDGLFPIRNWNCYEAVLHDLPRTNNTVEG